MDVESAEGKPLGTGLWNPRSQIRVRLLTGPGEAPDETWFGERIDRAIEARRRLLPGETTGYRLLNAEGDGVPGWTVDRFGDVLVSQITCAGLEAIRERVYGALRSRFPDASILQSNDLPGRRLEGLSTESEVIAGDPPAEVDFVERGLLFRADLVEGQKTGFYFDQRDNRALVERQSSGRRVLDLFAHGGAFGMFALRGDATDATFIESSAGAMARGERDLERNGFAGRGAWEKADVSRWLRQAPEAQWDLVICDPPPLARRRDDVEKAARAYKDLNRLALRRLRPGGALFTFSCSGAIDGRLFRQILFAAAAEASTGRRVPRLLAPLAAAPDHPVSIFHPEGEYLKGWWMEV